MSRVIDITIRGDARRLRKSLLGAEIRLARSRARRMALRWELWKVRYSLWREPPVSNTESRSD